MLSVWLVGFCRIRIQKMEQPVLRTNNYRTNNQLIASHYLDIKKEPVKIWYIWYISHIVVATEIFFCKNKKEKPIWLWVVKQEKYTDKWKGERKIEKEYQRYMIPICTVYESSHKKECNKASILIDP